MRNEVICFLLLVFMATYESDHGRKGWALYWCIMAVVVMVGIVVKALIP